MRDILLIVYVVSVALALGHGACVLYAEIQSDRTERHGTVYLPKATVGRAVLMLVIAPLAPVLNTFIGLMHLLNVLGWGWGSIERLLRIPLVKPAKKDSHRSS